MEENKVIEEYTETIKEKETEIENGLETVSNNTMLEIENVLDEKSAIEVKQKTDIQVKKKSELGVSSIESKSSYVDDYVDALHESILKKAEEKINSEKIIDKHAEQIAKIKDKQISVDTQRASIKVEKEEVNNKVEKQEIDNKLIVLNAEARRLKREQKQLDKEQKAQHKIRSKNAKWEVYKDKLTKMNYSYVPNAFILGMLLFFDGLKSFFDGLGAVSTAIVKAFKWILIIGIIVAVLFIIPVTRYWIVDLLSGR